MIRLHTQYTLTLVHTYWVDYSIRELCRKNFHFFFIFFSAKPVELIIVDSDPDAQMRLNVVNISEFFLLSGQIKSESKYSKYSTEEMTANSFKLDQHFGIIEGNIIIEVVIKIKVSWVVEFLT